jgi:hypothetical protein
MSKGILDANRQLKQAFGGCFAFGSLCILIVSISPGIPTFWLLILGVIPLFTYIGYGTKLSKKHKDNIGFSDSVYYLGFTLTLVSLFFAIVNERVTSETATQMTLQYFGFALATTIIGIVYRTYHNQFLYEDGGTLPKGEAERISSEIDSFSNAMLELKQGISQVTNIVSTDLPVINRDLTDGYKELGDNIKDLARSTSDSKSLFQHSMGDVSRPLNEAIQKISDDLNNQDVTIDRSIFYELENNLKKVNEEFADSVTNISSHLNDQKIDVSVFTKLTKNMNSLNGKFEKMNDKFDSITESYASALHGMNTNNIKALEESKRLNKELDKIKDPSFLGRLKRSIFG